MTLRDGEERQRVGQQNGQTIGQTSEMVLVLMEIGFRVLVAARS